MKQANLFIKYVISGLIIIFCLSFLIVGKPIADYTISIFKISAYNIMRFGNQFLGQVYSATEQYTFNITRKELESAIFKYIELNPKFIPPPEYEFSNQEYNFNDVFSPIYFYFQEENYIAVTLLSGNSNPQESILGLFIVIDLKDSTYDKDKILNRTIDYYENQKLLKMFEDRIVNPLRKQIEKKDTKDG